MPNVIANSANSVQSISIADQDMTEKMRSNKRKQEGKANILNNY